MTAAIERRGDELPPSRFKALRKRVIDAAALVAATAIILSAVVAVLQPLGFTVSSSAQSISELYRRDTTRADTLRSVSEKLTNLNKRVEFGIYLSCQLYRSAYPGTPRPQDCPKDP